MPSLRSIPAASSTAKRRCYHRRRSAAQGLFLGALPVAPDSCRDGVRHRRSAGPGRSPQGRAPGRVTAPQWRRDAARARRSRSLTRLLPHVVPPPRAPQDAVASLFLTSTTPSTHPPSSGRVEVRRHAAGCARVPSAAQAQRASVCARSRPRASRPRTAARRCAAPPRRGAQRARGTGTPCELRVTVTPRQRGEGRVPSL